MNAPKFSLVREQMPVMRPLLPTFDRLEPYLRRIDAARTYSNRGPLVCEFEQRLDAHFGSNGAVVSASSGTAALVGAIFGTAGRATPERPLAIVPSYTFVATALAAEMCGYEPFVVDVDPVTWMLDPERLRAHAALERTGVIVCVAPFGRAFAASPWERLQADTGVRVVFDAAASFDVLSEPMCANAAFGALPVVLSFHATKSFSTGEGGAVVSTDSETLTASAQSLNLGFAGSRDCAMPALNGKLSEYHAAIGLAELDGWNDKRAAAARIANLYRSAAVRAGIAEALVTAPAISGCYVLVDAGTADRARSIAQTLAAAEIGSRLWYGSGIAGNTHFANVARDATPVSDDLAARLLGLPAASDLSEDEVELVVATVSKALNR